MLFWASLYPLRQRVSINLFRRDIYVERMSTMDHWFSGVNNPVSFGPDSFIIDWFSYYFCCTRSCLDRIRICALYLSMRVFTWYEARHLGTSGSHAKYISYTVQEIQSCHSHFSVSRRASEQTFAKYFIIRCINDAEHVIDLVTVKQQPLIEHNSYRIKYYPFSKIIVDIAPKS